MHIERLLHQQGFGTRRACRSLVRAERFSIAGETIDNPFADIDPTGLRFMVDGEEWPYFEKAVILFNKPAGYECSRKPKHHPGIYTLLPHQFVERDIQSVGRLDEDTTGLLILTDDGQLIHTLSSPKRAVPKVYRVTVRHPLDETQVQKLRQGVMLNDDPVPVSATAAEIVDSHTLLLTITEGRYHQVKRMLAAVSNRVESLSRIAVGGLELPPDLPEGQWRWLDEKDLALLWSKTP